MKTFLRLFIASAFAFAHFTFNASAQDAPQLSLELKPGRRLLMTWHASAGTTRLMWSDSLGNPTQWQPLAGVQPMGGDLWQAEFNAAFPRAFFALQPPGLPVAPPNVRLVLEGGHFLLEWDSTSDASGYVVYVGLDASVGPGNAVRILDVPMANAVEILGLDPGVTYYIAIAAANAVGEGPRAPAVSGVFGRRGVFSGTAVRSLVLPGGTTFDVLAEGATITLASAGNPAASPLQVATDNGGHFRFPSVPVGDYIVGYGFEGEAGFLPGLVTVTENGYALEPLVIPSGPQPAPPGSTLAGTLLLSDGSSARNDLEEFGVHTRAELRAVLASGDVRIVHPDLSGAWSMAGLTPADYPVLLVADYHGFQPYMHEIAGPQAELAPIALQFPEALPTVKNVRFFQNGNEVQTIERGVPVTVQCDFENPDNLPLEPRWIAEFNGQRQLATGSTATFTFHQPPGPPEPGLGDPRDGGLVVFRVSPSGIIKKHGPTTVPIDVEGAGCWTGVAAEWSPFGPTVVVGTEPATISVKHGASAIPVTTTTIPGKGGYFEMPISNTSVPPYLLRVEKPGYMRFLWPFETRLPEESTFSVTAAQFLYSAQSPGGTTMTHSSGAVLNIPFGAVLDVFNQPWYGDIAVHMTVFYPFTKHPLPTTPELRGPNLRNGIQMYTGIWFEMTTDTGVPLTPTAAATLEIPVPNATSLVTSLSGYHQVETTGFFERWGYGLNGDAPRTSPTNFTIPLGTKGLFIIGKDTSLVELLLQADRTLGYPFDIVVPQSIFAITVRGPQQLSVGRLFVPRLYGGLIHVLDPRNGPGQSHQNISFPGLILSPAQRRIVCSASINTNIPPPALPAVASVSRTLTLTQSIPTLTSVTPTSAVLNSATHFLSRGGINSAADAQDYYTRINAPTTLAQWRTVNGFPARFGGPLTGVSVDDYATAYYYNLGDLGFARAQTMRIRISAVDGGYDTAFQVTNYRSIEDAICGRAAVATVCMDSAKRTDAGAQTATRYTRFYVYGSDGSLLKEADLDGAGLKGVPNLCVTCHGGKYYDGSDPNRTPNIGARFLPFDLEAFTYHPKFGIQKPEFARMNKGVLLTGPTAATTDLITGWYGTNNPLVALNNYNANYVPASWATNPGFYTDVFKTACRGCHNTRETTGLAQFSSFAAMQAYGFGNYAAGSSLQMPHAQRTWSIFWGERGSGSPNMPTTLQTLGGTLYR